MLAEPYINTNASRPPIITNSKEKMIDYTNLYIKNLDPQVTSYDLFQKFKDFGKIISARVMKDTQTGVSKGFGFVSFTRMEDANLAMQKMQGEKLHHKGIIITFHEPKKPIQKKSVEYVPVQPFHPHPHSHQQQQQQQQHQQQPYSYVYPTNQSPPTPPQPQMYGGIYHQHHHSQFIPDHSMSFKQPVNDVNGWIPPPPSSSLGQVKNTLNTVVPPPPPYAYSPMHHTTTTNNNNTYESNHFVVSPANAPVPPPGYSHHLERTTSNDSTNTFQRQKLREAILVHLDHQKKNQLDLVEDLVDMIQSLKKRELSLCLFNPTFLKQKITEAYNALYVFDEEDERRKSSVSVATTPSLRHLDDERSDDEEHSIASLLASLEGMPIFKKKKVLGDILFPHVKATGVRRAPKVTIWLLDSTPLEHLASIMYDHDELSRMANYASSQILL